LPEREEAPALQIPDEVPEQTDTAPSGATQKAVPEVTPDDWRVSARAIADELHEKDTRTGAHDSITNIADCVFRGT
jgi:hypothetical protein